MSQQGERAPYLTGDGVIWAGRGVEAAQAQTAPRSVGQQTRTAPAVVLRPDRFRPKPSRLLKLTRWAAAAAVVLGLAGGAGAAVWQFAASETAPERKIRPKERPAPAPVAEAVKDEVTKVPARLLPKPPKRSRKGRAGRGRKRAAPATRATAPRPPNVAAAYGWSLAETLAGPARTCAEGGDWARRSPDGRTLYLCGGGRFRVHHDGHVLVSCAADGCDKTTLYHLVRGR